MSSDLQLWLINHSNCITNLILHFLYAIDVLAYTITGPMNFLTRRQKLYGSNFAALGRIIIGEYDVCSKLINSPQRRGTFLGRAKLVPSRFPKYFPLFMSDADAGGDEMHAMIHQYFWETLIPPAFERTKDPIFDGYVANMVTTMKANMRAGVMVIEKKDLDKYTQNMVIKYIFHALFGIMLSKGQIKDVRTLFFGTNILSAYVLGGLRPYATLLGCFQCSRNKLFKSLSEAVYDSPGLANYVPSACGNISKKDFSEMLVVVAGIAGCIGTQALCKQVITGIPEEYPIQLDDPKEVMLAVLEAARIKSPVNNVNMILEEALDVTIDGKTHTITEGTVVAASIGLSSVDPVQFEEPTNFNPKRDNLVSASLNFNHVGFNKIGSGTRQCPGRNIAMKIATTLLIEMRKSSNEKAVTA